MSEYLKYNPANLQPENFLHPPTETVEDEIQYLARQLADILEGKPYHQGVEARTLLIGTELEVLFFSPDRDPLAARVLPREDNPNYQYDHFSKITTLKNWAENLRYRRKKIAKCTSIGTLGIEFRTRPLGLSGYLEATNQLRDLIQTRSKRLGVLPVVYSQHIHISLCQGATNFIHEIAGSYRDEGDHVKYRKQIDRIFAPVLPLVLLPEEFCVTPRGVTWVKGTSSVGSNEDPVRTEFRMLSSEWACDPSLNVTLSLRALDQAIHQEKLTNLSINPTDYREAVRVMRKDPELIKFFGASTLNTLANIVNRYPEVSRRKITVNDIAKQYPAISDPTEVVHTATASWLSRFITKVTHH